MWVLWEHWSGRGITSFLMFSPPLPSRPRQLTPLSTLPKHGIWRGSHDTPHEVNIAASRDKHQTINSHDSVTHVRRTRLAVASKPATVIALVRPSVAASSNSRSIVDSFAATCSNK